MYPPWPNYHPPGPHILKSLLLTSMVYWLPDLSFWSSRGRSISKLQRPDAGYSALWNSEMKWVPGVLTLELQYLIVMPQQVPLSVRQWDFRERTCLWALARFRTEDVYSRLLFWKLNIPGTKLLFPVWNIALSYANPKDYNLGKHSSAPATDPFLLQEDFPNRPEPSSASSKF